VASSHELFPLSIFLRFIQINTATVKVKDDLDNSEDPPRLQEIFACGHEDGRAV
jgi:hypothetical protein